MLQCFTWVACVGALLTAGAALSKPIEQAPGRSVLLGSWTLCPWRGSCGRRLQFLLTGRGVIAPASLCRYRHRASLDGIRRSFLFYFSESIVPDSKLRRTIGIVFDIVSWFIAVSAIITLGAVIGAVRETRRRRPVG